MQRDTWSRGPWSVVAMLLTVLAVAGLVACGPSETEKKAAASDEAFTALETEHTALMDKRKEMADLAAKVAAGAEALEVDPASGQTKEQAFEELKGKADALRAEVDGQSEDFMGKLVAFINSQEMEVGAEPTEQQRAALRMKGQEDLVYAMEYIEKGGDFARAEDIIERALETDPDNQELADKLAWIKEMRYINKERFEKVEKGMTEAQITELLGPVNINNIKDFPNNRKGWFYRKDPSEGGAAGIYFERKGGNWVVYESNYDAIAAN